MTTVGLRRAISVISPALALVFSATLVGTASAQGNGGNASSSSAPRAVSLGCGAIVKHSITLANNIGPCQSDGLVVDGNNITVDLGGHTITGSHQGCPGSACSPAPQQVGIDLNNVAGDTVDNGTVQYFDGGVLLQGGSGNTVTGIYAHDNINRDLLTNTATTDQTSCDYGDGIVAFSSSGNLIESNSTVHNGPFSGIALVGIMTSTGSFAPVDHNTVQSNQTMDNYVPDQTPNGGGTLCGSAAGQISGGMATGRQVQDMGIRIEGPDAAYNTVQSNQVSQNGLDGIAVFAYFCNLTGTMQEPANHDNTIANNAVSGTGDLAVQAASGASDSSANGIAILSEGNSGVDCTAYSNTITGNTSDGNFQDGIYVGALPSPPGHPQATTVSNNVADNNSLDGVGVQSAQAGPVPSAGMYNVFTGNVAHSNVEFDGADYNLNPPCGTDTWQSNQFTTVNQPCVGSIGG